MTFFEKFKKCVSDMNKTAAKLIKYGILFALGICLIGVATYLLNWHLYIFNYLGKQFGIHIITAGISLFSQFVIGGLVLDIIQKRRNA
ncbi:MAG: hypothetical protein FWE04_04985 [Oscillospiraceae bacterium]|nr:hypothetical protein [Oscillospiraceae bacterium]